MTKKKQIILIFLELFSFLLFIIAISLFLIFSSYKWNVQLVVLFLIIYVINLLVFLYIYFQRRTYEAKLSWFILFIIFPIIGHVIFLCFGNIKNYNILSRKDYIEHKNSISDKKNFELKTSDDVFLDSIAYLTKSNIVNTQIDFYDKGYNAFEQIFKDLENAKKYIFIEMYILKPSEIYYKLKQILFKKAAEGIKIKILVDDFGKWSLSLNEIDSFKKIKNIDFFVYSKIKFPFVSGSDTLRLHRKFILIDAQIVHSGGINISDEYSSFSKKYGFWADLNYRSFSSEDANNYLKLFIIDWENFKNEKINYDDFKNTEKTLATTKNNTKLIFIEDGPNIYEKIIHKTIVKLIYEAREKIQIASPYFVPDNKMFSAIKNALLSGVKIDFFIPGNPDKKTLYLAAKYYLGELLDLGLKVYVLDNIFLHSKFMIFDQKYAIFGTANLDIRSLFLNYELVNVTACKKTIKYLSNLTLDYKKISSEYKPEQKSKLNRFFKKLFVLTFTPLF